MQQTTNKKDPHTINENFRNLTEVYKELVQIIDGISKNYMLEKIDPNYLFQLLPKQLTDKNIVALKEFEKNHLSRAAKKRAKIQALQ
ncbi:MAG: hypothetical protein CL770_03195 [Chloroflexi bacterium]|nr:hypothetical protein [Chloroflexota bacterium]|tara:strand:+ start:66355 stop:66615 length:261 start_codon:yes stop_codon:yes gene_type:complete